MRHALLVMLALGGCARGGEAGDGDLEPDAAGGGPAPDAGPPPCVPMTTQLLVNATLDDVPMGTGWIQQLIQAGSPLVTDRDGRPEHTPPYKIWLGGLTGNMVTDVLTQDIAIPPRTTRLVLTGVHDVRTVEDPGETAVYDSAQVTLTRVDGGLIETILSLSNLTPKTGWTPFEHAFTEDVSGQMVRLRLSSTSDASWVTSFYFDTLALTATHGCP
jgi:hypothetical protein